MDHCRQRIQQAIDDAEDEQNFEEEDQAILQEAALEMINNEKGEDIDGDEFEGDEYAFLLLMNMCAYNDVL